VYNAQNYVVHSDRLSFLIDFSEQSANAIEHFAGTKTFIFLSDLEPPVLRLDRVAFVQATAMPHPRLS